MFSPKSRDMVWWQCPECGHEWRARIIDRAVHGEGCKVCETKFQKALPLLLMNFYAKKMELQMVPKNVKAIGLELETYLPEISLAVEFGKENSAYAKQSGTVKDYLCRKKGITLVRIVAWTSEIDLAEQILQAFAAADIFIRTDAETDLAIIRHRFFTWLEYNNLENQS